MEELAKVIPDCLSTQICERGVDMNDLSQTLPALDKLIEGLQKVQ